jgi:proline iminopeptidase
MRKRTVVILISTLVTLSLFLLLCQSQSDNKKSEVEIWPQIEPYDTGYLAVSSIHEIYYEQSGNPKGKPVFIVHGGPGGGTSPIMRRFCNPKVFRIVLFDQRGAGKSRPFAETKENNSSLLVEDMEKLRNHLGLDKVFLLGGSWGSTLSLLYAETYPENVSGMLLRGVWTATQKEIDHFYHGGAGEFFPEAYSRLLNSLPEQDVRPLPEYIKDLLLNGDENEQIRVANEWARYEMKISGLNVTDEAINQALQHQNMYAFALMENYYMANNCFIKENQIFNNASRIVGIPCTIINGRFDMCCPSITAYKLHKALPGSKIVIVENGGHGGWPIITTVVREMRTFEK